MKENETGISSELEESLKRLMKSVKRITDLSETILRPEKKRKESDTFTISEIACMVDESLDELEKHVGERLYRQFRGYLCIYLIGEIWNDYFEPNGNKIPSLDKPLTKSDVLYYVGRNKFMKKRLQIWERGVYYKRRKGAKK